RRRWNCYASCKCNNRGTERKRGNSARRAERKSAVRGRRHPGAWRRPRAGRILSVGEHVFAAAPPREKTEEGSMEKMDEGLKTLIEAGKQKGYLTYSQVNDYLPEDTVDPDKLGHLLTVLEEQGIELIDEAEAEDREAGPDAVREREESPEDLDISFLD